MKLCTTCNKTKPDGECQELHDKWENPTGDWQCHDCTDRFRDWCEGVQIDLEKANEERYPQ